jgi:hypothetical protein
MGSSGHAEARDRPRESCADLAAPGGVADQRAGHDRRRRFDGHGGLADAERQFPDDPAARTEAMTQLYKTSDVRFLSSCGWRFAAGLIPNLPLPGPNRSIRELITGTVVIETAGQPRRD